MLYDNVILTDADGVLLNWEYAFNVWMQRHGYELVKDYHRHYEMDKRYGITNDHKRQLVRMFNESAAIGFLPPLRDAIHYVRKLHEEHGYVFHLITSLSLDPAAQELRTQNIKKLFGETAFERFVYLDTGADKDEALKEYRGTNYWWIEDKPENAMAGAREGLECLLMEHSHNMHYTEYNLVKNWKEIYEEIVGV